MSSLFLGFSLAIATFSIKCLDAPEMSSCLLREDPDQQVLVRGAPKIVQKQQVEKKAD